MSIQFLIELLNLMHDLAPDIGIHIIGLEIHFNILPHIQLIVDFLEIPYRKHIAPLMFCRLLRKKVVLWVVDADFPVLSETAVGIFKVDKFPWFQHVETLEFCEVLGEVGFEGL